MLNECDQLETARRFYEDVLDKELYIHVEWECDRHPPVLC